MNKQQQKARVKARRNKEKIQDWERGAAMLRSTIMKFHKLNSAHGMKWKSKMIAHYWKKWGEFKQEPPHSCIARRDHIERELTPIVRPYLEYLEEQ